MTSWLWSVAMLVVPKIGAISYWAGATSLCWVLDSNAQLPQLDIEVVHVIGDPVLDGAEILVFELLSLRGGGAEERPSGKHQVEPVEVELLIDQKIFLLRAHGSGDFRRGRIAECPENPQGLL